MSRKVEFIESYIKGPENYDYKWNDNHGELIRCKDCAEWDAEHYDITICLMIGKIRDADDYCSRAVKK